MSEAVRRIMRAILCATVEKNESSTDSFSPIAVSYDKAAGGRSAILQANAESRVWKTK
jgi:hypothetical protein